MANRLVIIHLPMEQDRPGSCPNCAPPGGVTLACNVGGCSSDFCAARTPLIEGGGWSPCEALLAIFVFFVAETLLVVSVAYCTASLYDTYMRERMPLVCAAEYSFDALLWYFFRRCLGFADE